MLDVYNLFASQESYKRTTPKVGRNDPCAFVLVEKNIRSAVSVN